MTRQLLVSVLLISLLSPGVLLAQRSTTNRAPAQLRASSNPPAAPPSSAQEQQQPTTVRPRSRVAQRSYVRETRPRRRGMSKEEKILLVGIAGRSMGIGALAAGGHGLGDRSHRRGLGSLPGPSRLSFGQVLTRRQWVPAGVADILWDPLRAAKLCQPATIL